MSSNILRLKMAPDIQTVTPKRLGLSLKRKLDVRESGDSKEQIQSETGKKIPTSNTELTVSETKNSFSASEEYAILQREELNTSANPQTPVNSIRSEGTQKSLNTYNNEKITPEVVQTLHETIRNKEAEVKSKKLHELYKQKHNIKELEELVMIWRNGYREAVIYLFDLLKSRNSMENLNIKQLQMKLGIERNILDYFKDDTELNSNDSDE